MTNDGQEGPKKRPHFGGFSADNAAKGLPKDFLRPWLLMLLSNWSAHGYALQASLAEMGLPNIDQSALYRELRALEAEGLLRSVWDTAHAGPARRNYELTDLGQRMLGAWVTDIQTYQGFMSRFLQNYLQTFKAHSAPKDGAGAPPETDSPRDETLKGT
jgi:PadR family transcriptional regulator PadR